MGATLVTVNAITKEIYQGRIREQLNVDQVGYKRIERTSEGVETTTGGKYVTFPIRTRRNPSIGYRNEMEALQAAGNQKWATLRVSLKFGYGRVQLSGQVMKLARTNVQAFANAMNLEMTGMREDIGKDVNRIFYGDGTGSLAVLSGTQTVANQCQVANAKYLEVGQKIDIVQTGTGTVRGSNREITGISGLTVTYDGADITTDVNTDLIVRTGNWGREPNGLASIVNNTGTLFNVDPTVEPIWKSVIDSNGGVNRPLSESLMITMCDNIRTNGGAVSAAFASLGVRRSYFNLLQLQRRFVNTKEFTGGLVGLAFNYGAREIPIVEDVDAPNNSMEFLQESDYKVYLDEAWSWSDVDGDIWKWSSGFDAYEAYMNQYWEIGIGRRNSSGIMKDVTES